MGYTPHVLVIGGGSTGTGVARDLAMRGLEVTLVERGTLANGTSGAMHAVLHSGARYAVDDPELAADCRRENRRLREIAGPWVRETGGVFARLPSDPTDYLATARAACTDAGIETTALDGEAIREREPALSSAVESGFTVPDAVIDPFGLCVATARSAVRYGADVRTNAEVVDIEVERDAVQSVRLRTSSPGAGPGTSAELITLEPDYVVNAAGPAAVDVAALANLEIAVRPSQGAMVVVERQNLGGVVNRCRPRDEGDIAVPFGSRAILGTTDREIDDPAAIDRDPEAVDLVLDELASLVPAVANARPHRAYWGVRALAATESDRRWTIIDHEARDDIWGLTTVFGGKLTTHRLIAERVTDRVCAAFGIDRVCRTAEFALPGPVDGPAETPDPVLCPCEGVTRAAVRGVLDDGELGPGTDLRAVAARTHAGMGTCQGGRCGHRLAAELSPSAPVQVVDAELAAFHDRRWRGRRHVLWGANLAAAAADYERHATYGRDVAARRGSTNPIQWDAFDAGPGATPQGAEEP